VKRRSQREPLQYILGDTDFFHLRLKIDRRALIPRPETEGLCELITQRLSAPPAAILDLGTGSGAIALGLAAFYSSAMVTALDVSDEALALARENAEALGLSGRVKFLHSDWFAALAPGVPFDLVVANPPYLSVREASSTLTEVREHEPPMALASGAGGTEALLHIIAEAPRFLTAAGLLALETGIDQHAVLRERAGEAGFARIESLRDLSDRDRYLLAWCQ
jgi:release factor glutamine methyltransferase